MTNQLDGTTSKSFDKLITPIYKFVKFVIETSSKVRESLTYNKLINDPIYRSRQRKTIDEKLCNLD